MIKNPFIGWIGVAVIVVVLALWLSMGYSYRSSETFQTTEATAATTTTTTIQEGEVCNAANNYCVDTRRGTTTISSMDAGKSIAMKSPLGVEVAANSGWTGALMKVGVAGALPGFQVLPNQETVVQAMRFVNGKGETVGSVKPFDNGDLVVEARRLNVSGELAMNGKTVATTDQLIPGPVGPTGPMGPMGPKGDGLTDEEKKYILTQTMERGVGTAKTAVGESIQAGGALHQLARTAAMERVDAVVAEGKITGPRGPIGPKGDGLSKEEKEYIMLQTMDAGSQAGRDAAQSMVKTSVNSGGELYNAADRAARGRVEQAIQEGKLKGDPGPPGPPGPPVVLDASTLKTLVGPAGRDGRDGRDFDPNIMYDKVKSNKVHLGNKFVLSGNGDWAANDEWLRVMNAEQTGYAGGVAANRLWAVNDIHTTTLTGNGGNGGRLHISGGERLYLLNKEGVIVGKEWGGNGSLSVQGPADFQSNDNRFKGGTSRHNPNGWQTHFPWPGDNKNYIRGDTEIRGDTNNIGDLNVGGRLRFQASGGYGGDNTDPYYIEKIHDGNDVSHLRLTLNDNSDESLQIWGNSCGNAGGCGGPGRMAQKFQADGRVDILGPLCINGTCITDYHLKMLTDGFKLKTKDNNRPMYTNGTLISTLPPAFVNETSINTWVPYR